jgi:uncharacterized protein YciI
MSRVRRRARSPKEILGNLNLLRSAFLVLLAGCQSAPATAPANSSAPAAPTDEYVLVLLKTGMNTSPSKEESQKILAGHFANMQRLANEKKLLVAGPFATPKRDPDLRGLFVIDEVAVNAAELLASSDPTIVSGIMRLESHPMRTDAPLRAYLDHELAIEEQAKKEGRERRPGEGGRTYVLLTAEDGERAARELGELATAGKVLLWARLDATRGFAILDAKDVPACEELLGDRRSRLGKHVLDPWFGSGELVKLPTMPR